MAMSRVVVTVVCALALALPGDVRGEEPKTDDLTPQAEEHVKKATDAMKRGAYSDAKESFMRASFFAPNWRPLHFNLGVAAEAQGELRVAIREYEAFKPYATADEALVADQRIGELKDRIARFRRSQRTKLIAGAVIVTIGAGAAAGGGALVGLYATGSAMFKEDHKAYLAGGAQMILYGTLLALGGVAVLVPAVKARRKLDGMALGPTRLHWTGAGALLRF